MQNNEGIGKSSADHTYQRWNLIQKVRHHWQSISKSAGLISRKIQFYFLFLMLIAQGLFFLSDGLEKSCKIQTLITGIYLISFSSIWLLLLFFLRKRKKRQLDDESPSPSSSIASKIQSSKHKKYNEINEQNEQTQQMNMWHFDLCGQNNMRQQNDDVNQKNKKKIITPLEYSMQCNIKLNQANHNLSGKQKQRSKLKKYILLPIIQDLIIIMFSLPAIILTYEVFLESGENAQSSQVLKFWTGMLSYLSLKLISSRIKLPIMQISYIFCGFSYFIIKFWIQFGYTTEVICLSIIIFVQQLNYQISDIFQNKIYSIFKNSKLQNYFFEALRITMEVNSQNDHIKSNKSDLDEEFSNRILIMQSQQQRNNQTPRMYSPQRNDQNIQQHNQELDNQYYKASMPQKIELLKSRTLNEKSQSSIQFIGCSTSNNIINNNPPLKRTTTLNQKINELKMGGFYSQLFGLIPVGVAIINSNKNLLYASSQILQMLNCQDEQKALKILLNLSTNAQKSTQFDNEDDTESDEDEQYFYSPANCNANLASSIDASYNNNQNGNQNTTEKNNQQIKREEDNISQRLSPQVQLSNQLQHNIFSQPQQQQQQLQKNGSGKDTHVFTPLGYTEERSSRYNMNCEDEEDTHQRNTKQTATYNSCVTRPLINPKDQQSQQQLANFPLFDRSHQNSVNSSMVEIATERNHLIMLNGQSPYINSSSILGQAQSSNLQQQLGNNPQKIPFRKSSQNATNKDLRDERWISEENTLNGIQQQSINLQREISNPVISSSLQQMNQQVVSSQIQQGRQSFTNILNKHIDSQPQQFNYFENADISQRQITEEEEDELAITGSIINPDFTINELQFQKINSPKSGMDSAGAKKRGSNSMQHNLKQKNGLRSNQDNLSDNKTEAQQREESVFNILNMMMGQNEQNNNNNNNNNTATQIPQASSARIRSQRRVKTNQYTSTINSNPQIHHAKSNSIDPAENSNSPQIFQNSNNNNIYAKPSLQNQSTTATHSQNVIQQKYQQESTTATANEIITNSLAKQLDLNREKQSSLFKINNTNSHQLIHQNEADYYNPQNKNQDNNNKKINNDEDDDVEQRERNEEDITEDQNNLKQTVNSHNIQNSSATNYQNSTKKKQAEEGKKDFDDLLKQKQRLGYIQQEGNVSIMQIEYMGEQYILKIIIHTVKVGQQTEQKVAIIVMEKMWQDFMIKRVEDLISQKMQLFGSLSHELRTPLNCSISMLEVIHNISKQDNHLSNQLGEYIQPALNSNKLLLNMINDILDFVQIDNGSFKFGLVEFDLQNLLKECVSLVQIQAKMKNLTIACYFDPQTPKIIRSDPNRIRQVILNFLSNALKFTIAGHIIVYASAHKGIQEVVIGVKDTGIGINSEHINEIFKVFNKVDLGERQKLNLQGCGVGLALSNSIAKALGPQDNVGILVQSEKDQGSTFSFVVLNKSLAILEKEEDIYENDEISHERLFANFSIIRPKVTQISKDSRMNSKNKNQRNRHSPSSSFFLNQNKNNKMIQTNPKLPIIDGLNMSSDNSLQFNICEPTRKMRSVSLTQIPPNQRKIAINTNLGSSTLKEQQSPELVNEQQLKARHNFHNSTIGNPQSPIRNNSSQAHQSQISVYNNIEKKYSLLETIKSKDFQDMHLLDHTKYDSPAGFNSYHDDSDQGIIKKSLESIQNNILQFGCQCPSIIIVDDQEFNLFSLSLLLKQFYGIISDTAVNQAQVMQKISDKLNSDCCKTYRIIFMDINMPQKNGYEVAREITHFYHSHKCLAGIKPTIIACSAYNGEEDKKKAHAHGMIDFVTKPIMKVALDAIVSKYYENIQNFTQQQQIPN